MPYICPNLRALEDQLLAGDGDAASLIRSTVPGLRGTASSGWRQGAPVVGAQRIARGTAIATFEDGRYANRSGVDHAAIFLEYAGAGIWVLEQGDGDDGGAVQRFIPTGEAGHDGSLAEPSKAAAAFSVIELRA
ncbi:MAG: BPSL0067 family protein [Telluria sp.]